MNFCGSEGRLFIHFQVEGQRVARRFTPRKRLFLEQDIQIESNLLQNLDPSKIQKSSRLVLWSYLKSIATGEWIFAWSGAPIMAQNWARSLLEYIASRNVLGTNL